MSAFKLSDAMVTKLHELEIPMNAEVIRVLFTLHTKPNLVLKVTDLPNNEKEIQLLVLPTKGNNGPT